MSEESNEAVPEGEASPKKTGIVLPLILALAAAAAGSGVGVIFLGPAVAPALAARAQEADSKPGGSGHGGSHGAPVETLHVMENLVVNPAGSEGTRYLLVSVAMEPVDPGMVEELAAMDVLFRHTLLTTLGSRTVAELSDITKRGEIVAELQDSLDHLIGEGVIHRVYLPQYVIQ